MSALIALSPASAPASTPATVPAKSSVRWIAQISSCALGGNICAGSPTAIQPIGSSAPSGRALLTCSTPLMRISAPAPSREPGNSDAPVATNASSPISAPLTCACGPIRTRSPSRAGWPARPRSTAFSMTMQRSPSRTGPSSAVSTAPNRMRQSGPDLDVAAQHGVRRDVGGRVRCAVARHRARSAWRSCSGLLPNAPSPGGAWPAGARRGGESRLTGGRSGRPPVSCSSRRAAGRRGRRRRARRCAPR